MRVLMRVLGRAAAADAQKRGGEDGGLEKGTRGRASLPGVLSVTGLVGRGRSAGSTQQAPASLSVSFHRPFEPR